MSIVTAVPLPAQPLTGEMPDAIEHVERDDARVVLTRDGEPVAAIVPLHDLRALEELDEAEDAYLSRVAAEAVAQWEAEGRPPGISHADLARELGIDLTIAP
ncbi:MAG TPA: type II toxin-antitoxin system prevent-host-death family antitoxin [Rhodopila sp.]|jgi:prevent-host-death family protein|nr:type II toxin-antitoxin system prevent-host-death family antitoxin [Rhodopila sp.]